MSYPPRKPSTVSSTSCSLSSTGSAFEGYTDRRIPLGDGSRRKLPFSRLGALIDKQSKDRWGRRELGIRLPGQKTKTVETKYMRVDELERARIDDDVYYCAPKQLLYSKDTFKAKKAKAAKSSALSARGSTINEHEMKHAYIYHDYSECLCPKGGRKVILKVGLSARIEAMLPYGSLGNQSWLAPDLAHVVRIKELRTGKTKLLDTAFIDHWPDKLESVKKLWYSSELNMYFADQEVQRNLRTEEQYLRFVARPPKRRHSHSFDSPSEESSECSL